MTKAFSLRDSQRLNKVSHDWLTPPIIIERLGPFDLDPCASVGQPWVTGKKQFTIKDDGLAQKWNGYVWLNPPFGRHKAQWIARMIEHRNGVLLVPAAVECKWFLPVWESADAILFSLERWMFYKPITGKICTNTWTGYVLAAFGEHAVKKLERANLYGVIVSKWKIQKGTLVNGR